MQRIILLLAGLAMMPLGAQAGELFRWVDSRGIVHYSDTPPPKSAQGETIKISGATGSDEALPYETLRAKQNFPVTLYVGSACGDLCDQARSLLNKRGIPYAEKILKSTEDIDAFKKLSGTEGIPTLAVGKTYLGGFLAGKWHSELDIAGYPKVAPYGTAPYRAPGKPATSDAASAVAPDSPAKQ